MKKLLKFLMYAILAFFALIILVAIFADTSGSVKPAETSNATFSQVDNKVGCTSKYSEDKKEDIFKNTYKGKQFTWEGVVSNSDNGRVQIKIKPTTIVSDIDIELKNKKDGYDLQENMIVKFRFIMKREGGCFLPYLGNQAELIRN
jgi:hypothetical protein